MIGTNPRVAAALQSKYGPILGYRNGPFSCVITQTPEITTELFVKNSTKVNGRPSDAYFDVFAARSEATGNVGTGIVFATAERWRENRKFALMKAFGKDKTVSLYAKIQDEVADWIDWVDQSLIGKNKSVDFFPHNTISTLTMNVIGAITCDVRPSSAYASSRAESSPELAKLAALIPHILTILTENGAKLALIRLFPSTRHIESLGWVEWAQCVTQIPLFFPRHNLTFSTLFGYPDELKLREI
jgi:cytochrome P450